MVDTLLAAVGIVVKEPWADDISYEMLNYTLWKVQDGGDGCGYVALKDNIGVRPDSDTTVWRKAVEAGQSIYDLAVKYGHFDGTEEEFEAQYQAVLQAARDAASATNATNEQVMSAEALRVEAEQNRVSAETSRVSAEESRASAELTRENDEQARRNNESGRSVAEQSRATAEQNRVSAENSRVSAENNRADAEVDRRNTFEALEEDMETAIGQADAATAAASAINNQIVSAENSRVSAENGRVTAEGNRVTAEQERATAETSRATAENSRVTAEESRVSAETSRATAETNRETRANTDHNTATSDHETAASDHTTAAGDHTTAAADHTQAVADHAVMAGYDTRLGDVEDEVSQLGQKADGNVTDGYYYNNLGTAVAGEGWCISGKIPVNAGDTITYIPGTKWSLAHIVIFNASNSRLDYYNANADSRNITLPANSAYVLASFSYKSGAGIKIGDDFIFTPSIGMKVPLEEVVAKLGTDAQIGKAYSTTGNALIDKDGWMVVNMKVVPGDSVVYNAGKAESPCGIGVFSASGTRNDYYSASASDRTITISGSSSYIQASVAVGTAYKLTINGKSVFGLVLDVRNNKVAIDALASAQGKMSDAVSYDFSGILKPYKAVYINSLGVGDTLDINNNVNSAAWFGGILPCKEGDTFKISDAWGGTTVAPYVFVDSAYKILAFVTGAITTEVAVVAPTNTAYIVCSANNPDSLPHNYKYVLLYGIATHLDEVENEINGTFDTVPVSPVYVRKEAKDGTSFNANVKLYPEGFMTEMGQHLRLNNAREWSPINLMMNATHRETTQTLSVEVAKGGKRKNVSVPVRRVNQGLVTGKTAFLLCVGESTTEGSIDDPTLYDGTRHFSKFWGYPSALQYFALMDEAYYQNGNDIRTIGHKSNLGLTFQYNGQILTNRSFCVGYGGHATYWLLNYPLQMQTTASANIISAKDLWYFLGLATKTPYDQATYNEDVETWANDAAHWALMTQTPAGKYKVDGCEELWNKIRDHASTVCAGTTIPSTSITGSYTGSAEQLAALNAWAEEVFANPENPFFDITVARDGVTGCAFSLAKYLERYRTMDDAGNRLSGSAGQTVVGGDGNTYTIGTRVTDTSAWDVCTPTHIIFNIGINDNISNSVANTVANVKQLVGRVSVPVGYFVCRYGGVANSGQWFDVGTVEEVSLSSYNAQMVSELTAWFADNEVNGKYLLPIWQTMYPASSDTWCKETDVMGNDRFLYETAIHTGYFGYKSIGLECLSWLYYLITSATQF